MGILPYNQIYNSPGNNYDPTGEWNRQLSVRQNQLDSLNQRETLTNEQLQKKHDLEQTVSLLTNKIERFNNPSVGKSESSDGVVVAKSPAKSTFYSNQGAIPSARPESSSYLKGFFFDARI